MEDNIKDLNTINENIDEVKTDTDKSKSKKKKWIIGISIIAVIIAGVCIYQEFKMKHDLAVAQAKTHEMVTKESTRFNIIVNDLERFKSDILAMSSVHLAQDDKTDIISSVDKLITALNNKDSKDIYNIVKGVSDSIIDTGAYMTEDKVDDYLNKFTYMLESLAITSYITLDEAEELSEDYTTVVQTLGINQLLIEFSDILKEATY